MEYVYALSADDADADAAAIVHVKELSLDMLAPHLTPTDRRMHRVVQQSTSISTGTNYWKKTGGQLTTYADCNARIAWCGTTAIESGVDPSPPALLGDPYNPHLKRSLNSIRQVHAKTPMYRDACLPTGHLIFARYIQRPS